MKKVKYKSAEEKRKALEAEKQWLAMAKQHGLSTKPSSSKSLKDALKKKSYTPPAPTYRGSDSKPPSLVTTTKGGGSKVTAPKYTGTLIKGCAQMHKSNLVPVINQEQATEISRMRRG
jgi:esterase/lipase